MIVLWIVHLFLSGKSGKRVSGHRESEEEYGAQWGQGTQSSQARGKPQKAEMGVSETIFLLLLACLGCWICL